MKTPTTPCASLKLDRGPPKHISNTNQWMILVLLGCSTTLSKHLCLGIDEHNPASRQVKRLPELWSFKVVAAAVGPSTRCIERTCSNVPVPVATGSNSRRYFQPPASQKFVDEPMTSGQRQIVILWKRNISPAKVSLRFMLREISKVGDP